MPWFGGVVLLAFVDQLTKITVVKHFLYGLAYPFVPTINIQLVYNYGISFSLFSGEVFYYLILAFGLIITLGLMLWLVKIPNQSKLKLTALTLILGGAIGNLVDRAFRGYVIDFIDFTIGKWHWYNFNLADLWISLGAILMVLELIIKRDDRDKTEVLDGNHLS